MEGSTSVVDFYNGRSVFVTGATGFMGKVLLEKLLRSCPGIERIYLLMRPSRGKDTVTRLKELAENQIFDQIRNDSPNVLSKMVALEGDVTLPNNFGLSAADLQVLVDRVSIVFNLAATVRFDEELKDAVVMNVNGPRQLLAICRQMKELKAFVHVSTAFNNLHLNVVDEIIYPGKSDPIKLVDFINSIDEESSKKVSKELVGSCPNTYAYTKALAEQILEKERGTVPLAIVRPSMVTASHKEPHPGWKDNVNGLTGMILAGGKGFMRIFKRQATDYVADLIPVDYPINLMITVAWETATHRKREDDVVVYTSASSHHNPITFGQFEQYSMKAWMKYPPKEMMWYPSSECTRYNWYYQFSAIMWHYIPAFWVDLFLRLTGKRAKWVRLYKRAFNALSTFDYFCTRQWLFLSNNPTKLWSKLSTRDREVFYFDVKQIEWNDYMEKYILGARKFILKDDPSTVPVARRNLMILYLVRMLMRLVFFAIALIGLSPLLLGFVYEKF